MIAENFKTKIIKIVLQILLAILLDLNKFFLLADFLFNKRFFLNPKGKYITNEEIYIEFQNGIV